MIWCLHGFLGQGSDWDFLAAPLRDIGFFQVEKPDLFSCPIEHASLASWADAFVRHVEARDPNPVLLGYSLGGRLALHALLARPGLFRGAVIVSAGLGLSSPAARLERRSRDEVWAARFLNEPWPALVQAWNSQGVFQNFGPSLERREDSFDRAALAHALREWSPAQQDPLYPRLFELDLPLLWVVGEKDAAYVLEGRRAMTQLPRARLEIVPGAGHRVPWEAVKDFTAHLKGFLTRSFKGKNDRHERNLEVS